MLKTHPTSTVTPAAAESCEYTFLDEGPHPGCKEFAAPAYHDCKSPATSAVVIRGISCSSVGEPGIYTYIVLACTHHRDELGTDVALDPTDEVVAVVTHAAV